MNYALFNIGFIVLLVLLSANAQAGNIVRLQAPIEYIDLPPAENPAEPVPVVNFKLASAELPDARRGQGYKYDFTPLAEWSGLENKQQAELLSWTNESNLPRGINLSSDGLLSGLPLDEGLYAFQISAQSVNYDARQIYKIKVLDNALNAASISTGRDYSCAVLANGTAKCWGG